VKVLLTHNIDDFYIIINKLLFKIKGGKKKPLKAPKKDEKELDEVIKLY
jgi:hypothetical protein